MSGWFMPRSIGSWSPIGALRSIGCLNDRGRGLSSPIRSVSSSKANGISCVNISIIVSLWDESWAVKSKTRFSSAISRTSSSGHATCRIPLRSLMRDNCSASRKRVVRTRWRSSKWKHSHRGGEKSPFFSSWTLSIPQSSITVDAGGSFMASGVATAPSCLFRMRIRRAAPGSLMPSNRSRGTRLLPGREERLSSIWEGSTVQPRTAHRFTDGDS